MVADVQQVIKFNGGEEGFGNVEQPHRVKERVADVELLQQGFLGFRDNRPATSIGEPAQINSAFHGPHPNGACVFLRNGNS